MEIMKSIDAEDQPLSPEERIDNLDREIRSLVCLIEDAENTLAELKHELSHTSLKYFLLLKQVKPPGFEDEVDFISENILHETLIAYINRTNKPK